MAMGRGIAMTAAVLILLFCLYSEMVHAATYTVGDSGGWTFNTAAWPKGKRFRAGDTLVFNYSPGAHNVVAVDKAGYVNCRTPTGAKVFTSGNDLIKLAKGQNYFICNFSGHCEAGTKIAINAV